MSQYEILLYDPELHEEAVKTMPLREADIDEVYAALGIPPETAIIQSIESSEISWVLKYDDKIIGVFGLILAPENIGIPWFVATNDIEKSKVQFLRDSFDVIEVMLQIRPVLSNFVSSEHTMAIKWLEWLGFFIDKSQPTILHDPDVVFWPFVMHRRK